MREEFEVWLLKVHGLESEWQPNRNCFKHFPAHLAYQAWKSSREALVIEMQEERKARGYGEQVADALGFNDGISYCREAIEAAGVKTEGGFMADIAMKNMREERDILQAIVDNFDKTISGIPALARVEALNSEIAQLKAENAGLKTGYEAYERVNAELRAECEALKLKLEQLSHG